MSEAYVVLSIAPIKKNYNGIISKDGQSSPAFPIDYLDEVGFHQKDIDDITINWKADSKVHRDGCFRYKVQIRSSDAQPTKQQIREADLIMEEIRRCRKQNISSYSNIRSINLHAHSGVGSPFDGFGYPQEHMDFALQNGCEGLALTDHGNMNGFAYQVLHAKKLTQQGKKFRPIFGV